MNIHEYQAKGLLKSYGVPVLNGGMAQTPDAAVAAAQRLGGSLWVVKAQIHAGGRGKAGGIKLAHSLDEVKTHAHNLLGRTLVTHQTGPQGQEVHRLYIEAGGTIADELYLSLVVDRSAKAVGVIASTEGGMDIEHVAATMPEKIIHVSIPISLGIQSFHGRLVADGLKLSPAQAKAFWPVLKSCYEAFVGLDASLIEINPLVRTPSDTFMALDAKMSFDDNALYRHPNVAELRDISEEDPAERLAQSFNLNYVKLDGTIGCMVNGAGLAMATMDIIQLYGSSPANFLDVGGGATRETVTEAFKIILSDPNVKGILVNIFGGIMRCDIIAQGIIEAVQSVQLSVPLVVRLEGTNVQEGKALLNSSGLKLQTADNLAQAAEKIVSAVKEHASCQS